MMLNELFNKSSNNLLKLSISLFAIMLFEFYLNSFSYIHVFTGLTAAKGLLKSTGYLIVICLSLLSILIVIHIRSRILYLVSLIIICLSYFIDITYKNVNDYGFGFNDFQIIINETGYALSAISSHSTYILNAFILSIIFFIISLVLRIKIIYRFNNYLLIFPLISMLGTYAMYANSACLNEFPAPLKILSLSAYSINNPVYYGKRSGLSQKPAKTSKYNNILWIIDESVTGKYLSINGYDKETTPYLMKSRNRYINLGLTSSVSNCSSSTHLILRSGIQLKDLPDSDFKSLKKPSIFQYAKNAGYKTYYISSQSHDNKLQNRMNLNDLKKIDFFSQPEKTKNISKHMLDTDLILKIKTALRDSEQNRFIYVVKMGSHFHWEESYPDSETYFTPTLNQDDPLVPSNKEKALNSYANSVRWGVDTFFQNLLSDLEMKGTIIFYTSDHGQSILNNDLATTHCKSANAHKDEGNVPFLIFLDESDTYFNIPLEKNRYSQFQLFPSTLQLMGYELKETQGLSILSGHDAGSRKFYSGDIFGRSPSYINPVETAAVQQKERN